jgi:hypothetical protein
MEKFDCVDCANPCHDHHYAGKCGCHCDDCCDCKCILLARLRKTGDSENPTWTVDHSVRRFIRPVLMRDPQVECEENVRKNKKAEEQAQGEVPAPQQRETQAAKAPKASKARS